MSAVFLQSGDVTLRPVEREDVEFLQELVQHPEVRDTIGRAPLPVNRKQEEEHIEEISSDDDGVYFLIEYQGEKAGITSIHGLEDRYRKAEFGISIHPKLHDQGIGSKSVKMLAEYAFDSLNIHKLRGGYVEGNPASKRIMEKIGMKEEGRERHYKYVDGEWKDTIWMSILEDEWRSE